MDRPSRKRLVDITDSGRIAVLGDGSSWLIQPEDRHITEKWKTGARVSVAMAGHPESVITNKDDGTDARVAYAGQR
jgi:hypothetical protein